MVFQKAIAKADVGETLDQRVANLIDCITYSVFQYTSRGLFECDKLIFASQMTFQVKYYEGICYASNDLILISVPITDFINE